MGDERPRRPALAPLEDGADGAAARQLIGHAEPLDLQADLAHDGVGIAGGARDAEEARQHGREIGRVDGQALHRSRPSKSAACRTVAGTESGKSRSTKRSAVGCGSWLARPGRSFASMKA